MRLVWVCLVGSGSGYYRFLPVGWYQVLRLTTPREGGTRAGDVGGSRWVVGGVCVACERG